VNRVKRTEKHLGYNINKINKKKPGEMEFIKKGSIKLNPLKIYIN